MPICQPIQASISINDFRDKAYTFSVESVVDAISSPGRLIVSASAGYLLTTSLANLSRREHTFEHKQQADGSWRATGSVTVLCSSKLPTNGKIVIQNAQAESVVLTILATSITVARSFLPAFTVSQPALTFAPTAPGKSSFLVFTITPQRADVPVTLTTDAPDVFQLASDNRPNFGPALTVTPSTNGTFVHVRYVSNKPGMHSGQLVLHTGSETKAITLTARTTGLLPGVLMRATQPRLKILLAGLGAMLLVGSLAFAGYSNRCQLFPALCQESIADQGDSQADGSRLIPARIMAIAPDKIDKLARKQKNRPKMAKSSPRLLLKRAIATDSSSGPAPESEIGSRQVKKKLPPTAEKDTGKPAVGRVNPQIEVSQTRESELERALNYPIPN